MLQRDHTSCDTHQHGHVLSHDYFSSAFNSTLHLDIGLPHRLQTIRIGSHTSSTLVLNNGALTLVCVFSPLLFTLNTHDCTPRHQRMSTVKYEDDTTIICCIINKNESSCQMRINNFAEWCTETPKTSWTSHVTTLKRAHKGSTSYGNLGSLNAGANYVKILQSSNESILTGNITNWHGSSQPRTGRLNYG